MRLEYWCAGVVFLWGAVTAGVMAEDSPPSLKQDVHASRQEEGHRLEIVTKEGESHVFNVEVAFTPDQQRRGLMFRTELAADGGMLFDFRSAQNVSMWMKNTLIPLDMLFIDSTGTVAFIAENTTPESTAVISSTVPVRWVLEVAGGTASRLRIRAGDRVEGPDIQGVPWRSR